MLSVASSRLSLQRLLRRWRTTGLVAALLVVLLMIWEVHQMNALGGNAISRDTSSDQSPPVVGSLPQDLNRWPGCSMPTDWWFLENSVHGWDPAWDLKPKMTEETDGCIRVMDMVCARTLHAHAHRTTPHRTAPHRTVT